MSTRRKQYRVYGNGVLLSEPGISARDMKSLVALIRANGRKARVDEYSGRHDIWITTQDDGGYMDVLTAHIKDRNKSGGRVTYTVATIDPYTQRHTSRLGRQVSKREAMKIADLWERNGAKDVCVIDSRGIIHRQPSNRNRSGGHVYKCIEIQPMVGTQLGYRTNDGKTPGKGRKINGYQFHIDGQTKFVDTLAQAKRYIDNY